MPMVTRVSGIELACVRAGRLVFKDLHFSVGNGEILAVRGPNGAGKSSLLRLIAGFLQPSTGRLIIEGGDNELSLGEQLHYLGHQDPLKPSLTVAENLAFWHRLLSGSGTIANALEAVGLGPLADIPALYLSAGQRRRLSLARLVAVPRPVWLLDEPNSALDDAGQLALTGIMAEHVGRDGIIITATHGVLQLDGTKELILQPAGPSNRTNAPREARTSEIPV
jgi:heme exporter protein A